MKIKKHIHLILLILILFSSSLTGQYEKQGRKILHDKNSLYYRIVIFDEDNFRYLVFGNNVFQTKMDLKNKDKVTFEYARAKLSTFYLKNKKDRVLLLGLGGGSIVKFIQKYFPEIELDIAEIDPMVIDVAKKYFELSLMPKTKAYAYDGRIFIRKVQKKYDIMMLDAFNSDYIPFHLMTKEYLKELKTKLNKDGIVLQNIWTSNELMKRILNTFKSEFKYIYIYKGITSLNAVILASDEKIDLSEKNIDIAYNIFKKNNIDYDFNFKSSLKRYVPYNESVKNDLILTDDHAPVNYYHGIR